jgi:starch phosphorylase
MKVLVNGGINLSELDGWWAEAYVQDLGWAIGDGQEHGTDPAWDSAEAERLYDSLERQVIPEFYARDEQGIPRAWVARMRESMARLTPYFSADRAVREYTVQHYLTAAERYHQRAMNNGGVGQQMVDWQRALDEKWSSIRFGAVKVETCAGEHTFEVQVYLDGLDPNAVRVELYANGVVSGTSERKAMALIGPGVGSLGDNAFRAAVPASRPAADYTARIIPNCNGVEIPLEDTRILWQR